MKPCPKCGNENPDKSKFCLECAAPFPSPNLDGDTENPWKALGKGIPEGSSGNQDLSLSGATIPPEPLSPSSSPSADFPYISKSRYEIRNEIGAGGMGKVYRAYDSQTKREVALKRLISMGKESEEAIERFKREAHTISKLSHPYIVPLFDVGMDEEGPFLTMQYIAGETLESLVKSAGKLEEKKAVEIFLKICDALLYAHKQGVIHRDIKPGNIMLDKSGHPRLLDFGLARMGIDTELSVSGAFMGTRYYASPEQMRDAKRVDQRSDIYSLGAVLYFMLTGESPKVVRSDKIPATLAGVIFKAMEEKIEDRYYSVEEMMGVLKGKGGERKTQPSVASHQERPKGLCNCGKQNEEDARFCEACGKALFEKCPSCSKEISGFANNCKYCGVNVQGRKRALSLLGEAKELWKRYDVENALNKLEESLKEDAVEEARHLLKEVKEKKASYQRYMEKGDQAFQRENYPEALKLYESALGEIPTSKEAEKKRREAEIGKKKMGMVDYPPHPPKVKNFTFLDTKSYICTDKAYTVHEYKHDITGMEFILIPGGKFLMGSEDDKDEQPVHEVKIKSFLMSKYPVTYGVWKSVMQDGFWKRLFRGNAFQGSEDLPVESVSWNDVKEFCEKTGLSLPTEAEWEYACRAGTKTKYYWGDSMDKDYCWSKDNSGNMTHPVGEKKPNAFGLYDMSGNVWEWCEDWYHHSYNNAPVDGSAWLSPSGFSRVCRGGSWDGNAVNVRPALRGYGSPDGRNYFLGFRCVVRARDH